MKLKLNEDAILNKKFESSEKGYDPLDVDKFLDLVLDDYRILDSLIEEKNKEIKDLEGKIEVLNKSLQDLKENQELVNLSFVKKDTLNDYRLLDNLDLLKRCAKYEKKLYSLGVDPSKIK